MKWDCMAQPIRIHYFKCKMILLNKMYFLEWNIKYFVFNTIVITDPEIPLAEFPIPMDSV